MCAGAWIPASAGMTGWVRERLVGKLRGSLDSRLRGKDGLGAGKIGWEVARGLGFPIPRE